MKTIGNKIKVTYENAVFFSDKLYFTDMHRNEMCAYDITTDETELICKVDSEESQMRLFGAIISKCDEMYLVPFSAKCMYKVNVNTGEYESIQFKSVSSNTAFSYLSTAKFLSAHLYEDKIYLMPVSYPAIVEYNCTTGEIQYYDSWLEEAVIDYNPDENALFRKTMLLGDYIYAPFCGKNAVLKFNVITKETQILSVGSKDCAYSSICFDGKCFWLSPRGVTPVVRWNEENDEVREYTEFPEHCNLKPGSFANIFALNDFIVLLPMNAEMAVQTDVRSGEMQEFKLNTAGISNMSYCESEEAIYFFAANKGLLFIYDKETGHCEERYISFPDDIEKEWQMGRLYSYNVFRGKKEAIKTLFTEDYNEALQDYIGYACREEQSRDLQNENSKSAGQKIIEGVIK